MCTVVFAWQMFDNFPLVLAANRDEAVDRPSDPPMLLQPNPPLWGGRDRVGGGTWLAVDPRGRICAVTNRHPGGKVPERDASRNSRGQLPMHILNTDSDDSAVELMGSLRSADFNPVNVLYVSTTRARWVGLDDADGHQESALTPGVHVLTEQNPDDASSVKATGLLRDAGALAAGTYDPDQLLVGFRQLLRSHSRYGDGPGSAPCIHEQAFGTVSSATVRIGSDSTRFEHAEGHPCVNSHAPVLA